MPITFEESQAAIARLVKHFLTNRETYRAPAYKEAHARQEFIDPLFAALGWDVANAQQAAPDYREVVVEDTVEIAGQKKAPDYVFRVGHERKFFVEAKKPGVDLKNDAGPAYQLRRYAWTAKLPLSILTDFEELAIYDCRARPTDKDKASAGRLHYFTCETYADHWRTIWDLFSREAVWGGAFDKFATASGGKRGTSTVDAEFLKEIEGWRETLARNLALRNEHLSVDEVNDAVQRTIDRLIFLRMAEDRGIEDYGRLQHHAEGDDIYRGLLRAFRHADARYNSGLFDFSRGGDTLTPSLVIDDKVLRPIIAGLYFPQSPYEFSVLPVEILGNIYEQFLGKVIRLTSGHQAKVEVKPEVKKAGGVYYTPAYIVEYIVKQTVGVAVMGKSPSQLRGFRVLDPACGSGSFLLGAYQFLLDYYLNWYTANAPEKYPKAVWTSPPAPSPERISSRSGEGAGGRGVGGEVWRLTAAEKKRILLEHIFGVDIDRQAVEVTKLSLLLKVLETESDESLGKQLALLPAEAKERVLPNLDHNIKCGNSLIGPDYFTGQLLPDADELRRVNPFDWAREFPQVFNNRPLGSLETLRVSGGFECVIGNPPYGAFFGDGEKDYIRNKFRSYKYKYDSYIYFIEKALHLVIKEGYVSFITPELWLKLENCAPLRKLISENAGFRLLKVCGENVFANAVVNTIVFSLHRGVPVDTLRIETGDESWELPSRIWMLAENFAIDYRLKSGISELVNKVSMTGQPLSNFGEAIQGITPYDKYRGQDPDLIKNRGYHATRRKNKTYGKWLAGKDLSRYALEWSGEWLSYGAWLAALRDPRFFEGSRLLFREIPGKGKRIQATSVEQEVYYHGHSVTPFKLFTDSKIDLRYLLGLVNSKLISWHGGLTLPNFGKDIFPKLNPQDISALPIRPINFSDPADKARHDQMVTLVEQMLDLHKRLAATTESGEQARLQRLIDSTDGQIDTLVYELYGLTAEEVAVVEGRASDL